MGLNILFFWAHHSNFPSFLFAFSAPSAVKFFYSSFLGLEEWARKAKVAMAITQVRSRIPKESIKYRSGARGPRSREKPFPSLFPAPPYLVPINDSFRPIPFAWCYVFSSFLVPRTPHLFFPNPEPFPSEIPILHPHSPVWPEFAPDPDG